MTFNTKDLRDGHLPLVERIDIALRRVTNGEGQMRVPVEATDPDIVLYNCRDRITELEAEISRRPLPAETRIDVHAYDNRISKLRAELDAKGKRRPSRRLLRALAIIKPEKRSGIRVRITDAEASDLLRGEVGVRLQAKVRYQLGAK